MGIASLILGIFAMLVGLITLGSMGWLGIIMSIIGIILGAMDMKNPGEKGVATAGLVLSIIGLILCILLHLACAACTSCVFA